MHDYRYGTSAAVRLKKFRYKHKFIIQTMLCAAIVAATLFMGYNGYANELISTETDAGNKFFEAAETVRGWFN